METTAEKTAFERQEHLAHLLDFSKTLGAAIRASATPAKTRAAVAQSLHARCVGCSIPVSGEELLALAEPGPGNPKIERLRKGDCARQNCNSSYYSLAAAAHPGLYWPQLLGEAEASANTQAEAGLEIARETAKIARQAGLRRLAIGLAILVLLLLARQCYLGGAIPLLRQPEKFEVDRAP